MYTYVKITLHGKTGRPLSFRYDFDNELEAQIALPQDCAETCTNIKDLMTAINKGVICDGNHNRTLREIIEAYHDEEEEEIFALPNHLEEYDKFVQSALRRYKDFSKLKSVVIETFGFDEGLMEDETLDQEELEF